MSDRRPRERPTRPEPRRLLTVCRLGRTPYLSALETQRRLQAELQAERGTPATLILTEHEPVFTLGRNHPHPDLRIPAAAVAAAGIPIVQTERGGDITYHGPGQLVAYAIVDLRAWRLGAVDFVAGLEQCAIRTLTAYGISGERKRGARGAWAGDRKIASVGVNVRRGVTMHGLALNVRPDLEHFAMINACGLAGVEVTSILRESGREPGLDEVGERFTAAFVEVFNCRPVVDPGAPTGQDCEHLF